eukprot:COSAG05_NODE_23254_length_259_cov_0.650000_1_plen_60_part_10
MAVLLLDKLAPVELFGTFSKCGAIGGVRIGSPKAPKSPKSPESSLSSKIRVSMAWAVQAS